jgi:uncharacterized protein
LSTSRVDLSDVPVVDNHAHPLALQQPQDVESFRRYWSESPATQLVRDDLPHSVNYLWTLRRLGDCLGVEASEDAILRYRSETPFERYARDLVQKANLEYLLLDLGYPPAEEAYSVEQMEEMLGIKVGWILRLETLLEDLVVKYPIFEEVRAAFDEIVSGARRDGYVALKSIAAYRTGLAIEPVKDREAEAAFDPVRRVAEQAGSLRLASKPLIDYFVLRAIAEAARQDLPVQFHTGYGDPDLDLRLVNPLHLRPIFEDPALSAAPIVLLHESYPYTAEAAYLAAVYANAYVDIAFTLPPLDRRELKRVVGIAMGAAPASKVMCSSDGVCIPEQYWLGAVRARDILGDVLSEMVEDDEIGADDASRLGRMVLRDNAMRLYRLG